MSCKHDCPPPPIFPRTIFNRPGLPTLDYRVGAYAELREHMLQLLNQHPALSGWTHRGVDDPGIALIESVAIVGDILTFYQQLYANELYLRTAQWDSSVAELVRLLGYRLAPGVAGEASFALAVKGTDAITVPKGFGMKAQLESGDKPAEFESTQELVAYPALSAFNLYRPRSTPYSVTGTQIFYIYDANGIPEGLSFKKGDRVLLGQAQPSASNAKRLNQSQILIVEESWKSFGTLYVKFTTPLKWSGSVFELQAYKLGESHRHFGHSAPPVYFKISGTTTVAASTWYFRDDWEGDTNSVFYTMDFSMRQVEMPLDKTTKNIVAGNQVIVQATITTRYPNPSVWESHPYTLVGKVASVADGTFTFASVSGPSTVLTFEENLLTLMGDHASYYDAYRMDIRSLSFLEVQGEAFALRAQHQPNATVSGNQLYYYGTDDEVQALLGRTLMLEQAEVDTQTVTVSEVQSLAPADVQKKLFRRVTVDAQVSYADYGYDAPVVTVYGNVIPATQGKTQDEIVLGNGDRRSTFQTFALPKAPLTYLLDETRTPAQTPELTVYVDRIAWTQVESFFNYRPEDAVYVVRQDEDGKSFVQFGDGKNGRRLPTGVNNVSVVYRAGSGAHGDLKDGAKPSITGKLVNFDKLYLPAPVLVGADAEISDNARIAAPGKMQSLGRMVSLADIEAEALALPHVLKVSALWSAPEGVPLVRLTVLTESGATTDTEAVRESMQTYNHCRGPARYPIDVVQGIRQYVYLNIEVGYESERREEDVIAAIKQALGLTGEEGNGIDGADGLFGLHSRRFGQNAHKSQIIGAVQNASGVTWVKLNAAQNLNLGIPAQTDPTALAPPTVNVVDTVLACTGDRLLALHPMHLVLSLSKAEIAQECEA